MSGDYVRNPISMHAERRGGVQVAEEQVFSSDAQPRRAAGRLPKYSRACSGEEDSLQRCGHEASETSALFEKHECARPREAVCRITSCCTYVRDVIYIFHLHYLWRPVCPFHCVGTFVSTVGARPVLCAASRSSAASLGITWRSQCRTAFDDDRDGNGHAVLLAHSASTF